MIAGMFNVIYAIVNGWWVLLFLSLIFLYDDIIYWNPKFFSELKMQFDQILNEEFWGDISEKKFLMKRAGRSDWIIFIWAVYNSFSWVVSRVVYILVIELILFARKVEK